MDVEVLIFHVGDVITVRLVLADHDLREQVISQIKDLGGLWSDGSYFPWHAITSIEAVREPRKP